MVIVGFEGLPSVAPPPEDSLKSLLLFFGKDVVNVFHVGFSALKQSLECLLP